MLLLMLARWSWAQIEAAPPTVKLGPPSAAHFMGPVPAKLQPPSSDPHDLNGFYVSDIARAFGRPPPGGAPGGGGTPPPGAPPPSDNSSAGPASGAAGSNIGSIRLETTAEMLCRPEAQITTHDYGEQIVQTPGRITIIMENNHIVRRIYMDRSFPKTIRSTYAGYSTGHWDGDTLVVETRAINAPELAVSAGLTSITQMTERLRKVDGGESLENRATLEGIGADGIARTGTLSGYVKWRPDLHLQEFVCEDGAGEFFQ